MPSYDELRLVKQSIEALKRRTLNDLDALAAQVDLLLPKEESARGREFRRYTRADWGRFIEGIAAGRRSHKETEESRRDAAPTKRIKAVA
jgi:hypothetical protein